MGARRSLLGRDNRNDNGVSGAFVRLRGLKLGALYSKNAIVADVTGGTHNGLIWHLGIPTNLIWGRIGPGWTVYLQPLHASLCCTAPSLRSDQTGAAAPSWAVVNWVAKLYRHPGERSGVSILQLSNGEITRETLYY